MQGYGEGQARPLIKAARLFERYKGAEKINEHDFSDLEIRAMTSLTSGTILIVGASGGASVGASLFRGAKDIGIDALFCDINISQSTSRFLNGLSWRLCDRRPPYSGRLEKALSRILAREKPQVMVSVGTAAVQRPLIEAWRAAGVFCAHYSTDDPWNPGLRARWHFNALKAYDVVFTPRRRNMDDLVSLPCRYVSYLPFGYDPHIMASPNSLPDRPEEVAGGSSISRAALFVGGADNDRTAFFRRFIEVGGEVSLVGGYWHLWPDLKRRWLGLRPPDEALALTLSAAVNIILARRANRDGHTMRSFEAGAAGGCLLVEDTPEHRDIFGEDGAAVRFFSTAREAALIFLELLADSAERRRMANAVKSRILDGRHSYGDRLQTMIREATGAGRATEAPPA